MDFAQRTVDLARQNVAEGGRPFATVIARDGEVLAESPNRVAQTNDPTAHAEILAIRDDYAAYYVDNRKYFELDTFYDEIAKPWQDRRLPMRYEPRADALTVYQLWQERNQ